MNETPNQPRSLFGFRQFATANRSPGLTSQSTGPNPSPAPLVSSLNPTSALLAQSYFGFEPTALFN